MYILVAAQITPWSLQFCHKRMQDDLGVMGALIFCFPGKVVGLLCLELGHRVCHHGRSTLRIRLPPLGSFPARHYAITRRILVLLIGVSAGHTSHELSGLHSVLSSRVGVRWVPVAHLRVLLVGVLLLGVSAAAGRLACPRGRPHRPIPSLLPPEALHHVSIYFTIVHFFNRVGC